MDEKGRSGTSSRDLAEAWTLGLMFPLCIGVGFGIGYWLDGVMGSRPWLGAIFTALGAAAAFMNLFRIGLRASGRQGDGNDGPR